MPPEASKSAKRCTKCVLFRRTLRALDSRLKRATPKAVPSKRTNNRYLTSAQKAAKLVKLAKRHKANRLTIKRLQERIQTTCEKAGISVSDTTHSDLSTIVREHQHEVLSKYPRNSFAHLFWKQQAKAARLKSANSMKWHPLMIRWCLYLRHFSGKGYELLRDSFSLPSQRTLRDYTYYNNTKIGFSTATDRELFDLVSTNKEHQMLVCVIFDEMYIREQIVYDKHSGEILGFTDLGDVNNHPIKYN